MKPIHCVIKSLFPSRLRLCVKGSWRGSTRARGEPHGKENVVIYLSEKIWLGRHCTPARPYVHYDPCKPMSSVTLDLAQIDTSLLVI